MILEGVIDHLVYRNEDNGYSVASVLYGDQVQQQETVVVGYFPSMFEGELFKFDGEFTYNPKFGRQFKVKKHYKVVPTDAARTQKLLSGGLFKGIGPFTAGQLVKVFGDDTMKVLESRSVKILEVRGVGPKTAQLLWDTLDTYSGKLDIITWMVDYGFSNKMIQRITKWFKDSSITKLRDDPYILTYISGIGFNKADAFAHWVGIQNDDPKRVQAGLCYVLMADEGGNTYFSLPKLRRLTAELLKIDLTQELFKNALYAAEHVAKAIKVEPWGAHALPLYFAEKYIAEKVVLLSKKRELKNDAQKTQIERITDDYEKRIGIKLNSLQRYAVMRAAIEGISILTGAPGTGKTLTIGAIINAYRIAGKSFALCAPTGRAAKRMTETIGYDASTIHRLLEFNPQALGGFNHNQDHPLEVDLVIVDEISMVDVRLMQSLLKAIDEKTSIVLVGDENQLPSIGPGSILGDLILSDKVAFTRLTELYRQAAKSLIVRNAHLINKGNCALEVGARGLDFIWHTKVTPKMVVKVVSEYIPKHYGIAAEDTIVLSPIRRAAGDLNVNNLNALLQEAINPTGAPLPTTRNNLRVGDRVVHNVNDYTKQVFNGDLGVITGFDPKSTLNKGVFYVDYYGQTVTYELIEADQIELARAISIHRSQGGEYEAIVIVLPDSYISRRLLSRNLLYTAVTRSRKLCILLGEKSIVHAAIKNNAVSKRSTKLKEFVDEQYRMLYYKKV